ncbi:MAG: 5-formyltetrahydrofolate cyclo-ligase [Rickettsiaceae bacterium]|jgi:5-formyltetrahydrofolate cyclo-ligase|nr:5-formyltetrahydrofolate cyclo-ligase [Rickettsiaceae bacterium]
MNKSTIRKAYKQKRLALTAKQVESYSKEIADNFIQNLLPKIDNFPTQKLAFYMPANKEVDPYFIIEHCQNLGNIIAMPRIIPDSLVLDFKRYKAGDDLVKNYLYPQILEPKETSETIIPDIIFVPLVAFDANCNRIGMGKGFYDSTINNFRKTNQKKIFIGLGYDWQNHDNIDVESNDEYLNFVISQNNIFSRSQSTPRL